MNHLSIEKAKDILYDSPKMFREAIQNLVLRWDQGIVDVSCIVTAFVDSRNQISNLELEKTEIQDELKDLRRDLDKIYVQLEDMKKLQLHVNGSRGQ